MWFVDSISDKIINLTNNVYRNQEQQLQEVLEKIADPMAKEIKWRSLTKIRWSTTYKLMIDSKWNLVFYPSKFFPILLIGSSFFYCIIGLVLSYGGISIFQFFDKFNVSLIVVFLIFPIIIWFWLLYFSKSIVFDRQLWCFYRWKPQLSNWWIILGDKNIIPLNSIYAIQILCIRYKSLIYEINLVLKDKTRINVISHGDINEIKEASKELSEYLWVPLWDISEIISN